MFYIEKIDSQLIPMLRLSKQWGPPPGFELVLSG
jgi:hypothetical protein